MMADFKLPIIPPPAHKNSENLGASSCELAQAGSGMPLPKAHLQTPMKFKFLMVRNSPTLMTKIYVPKKFNLVGNEVSFFQTQELMQ